MGSAEYIIYSVTDEDKTVMLYLISFSQWENLRVTKTCLHHIKLLYTIPLNECNVFRYDIIVRLTDYLTLHHPPAAPFYFPRSIVVSLYHGLRILVLFSP